MPPDLRRAKRMLENVTATGGARIAQDEVPVVAALLLVDNGVCPTELAERFHAVCRIAQDRAGAAMLLGRLAEQGLDTVEDWNRCPSRRT